MNGSSVVKKSGRPPVKAALQRRMKIVVYLSDAEFDAICKASAGTNLSTWARTILLRESKK